MPKKNIYFEEIKFNEIHTYDYYFVDKTKMLSKLIEQKKASYLITRPRRFGKSLNLRMIKKNSSKNHIMKIIVMIKNNKLFDGLEVSKDRRNMR